jgi:branched-chain amino acid transport system permease protein
MTRDTKVTYGLLALFGIFGPILFPDYTLSIAYLWMMVLMASTWDTLGGQMGYNSLGNITFFGVGMYVSAIVQIAFFYEGGVGEYTSAMGSIKPEFTQAEYFWGLGLGNFQFLHVRSSRPLFRHRLAWPGDCGGRGHDHH